MAVSALLRRSVRYTAWERDDGWVNFGLRFAQVRRPLCLRELTSSAWPVTSEKCQQRKSRLFDHLVPTGEHLSASFGQPGSPQSFFFVSQKVFALPRARQVFEIGNTQRGIELPLPSHGIVCLLRPSGHCVACGGDA